MSLLRRSPKRRVVYGFRCCVYVAALILNNAIALAGKSASTLQCPRSLLKNILSIHPRGTMTFTTRITLKHRMRVAAGERACVVGEDWGLGSSMRLMGSSL